MKILFVSPEIVPYAASGGLADVAEALPVALNELGHDVARIMPKYKGIENTYELEEIVSFIVETKGRARVATVYSHFKDNVTTYFIGNQCSSWSFNSNC